MRRERSTRSDLGQDLRAVDCDHNRTLEVGGEGVVDDRLTEEHHVVITIAPYLNAIGPILQHDLARYPAKAEALHALYERIVITGR
jgi:hypothetical protein